VGHTSSFVNDMSYSEAFLWTRQTGMQSLGVLPRSPGSYASGVSGDGSVIVGGSFTPDFKDIAFRWTAGTGMVSLDVPSGATEIWATGISANGQVIFGGTRIQGDGGLDYSRAMRWTESGGAENLGYLAGWERESIIHGSSADGSILVGRSRNQLNRDQAIQWSAAEGMQGLGFLPGGIRSSAWAVSGDGSTIVGSGNSDKAVNGTEAFRWTEDKGIHRMWDNPPLGGFISSATDLSFDGSAVVGRARFGSANILEAFLWNEVDGMRSLNSILNEAGVNLNGWLLTSAQSISADGLVIVGNATKGTSSRGFVLDFRPVPEPSSGLAVLTSLLLMITRRRRPVVNLSAVIG